MQHDPMPAINYALCRRCGTCIVCCPSGALEEGDSGPILNGALCSYCGDCEDICPAGAIALPYTIILRPRSDQHGG